MVMMSIKIANHLQFLHYGRSSNCGDGSVEWNGEVQVDLVGWSPCPGGYEPYFANSPRLTTSKEQMNGSGKVGRKTTMSTRE